MVEKYYDFYETLKYKEEENRENLEKKKYNKCLKIKKWNIKIIDELFLSKNTLQAINENIEEEINKYRELINKLQVLPYNTNENDKIKYNLIELNNKMDEIYSRIDKSKEYFDKKIK